MTPRLLLPWPFLLLVGGFSASRAEAATVEEAVRSAIADRLALSPGDVELSELTVDPAAPIDAEWKVQLPEYTFGNGHVALSVEAGTHRLKLNPKVTLYAQLPVVDAEVPQGALVPFHMERRPVSELHGSESIDPLLAWDATVSLHRGRVLTRGVVRRHPDLREGAQVTILVQVGGASVYAPGELLADALVGERTKVKNLATKAELVGTLRPDGRIHLGGS